MHSFKKENLKFSVDLLGELVVFETIDNHIDVYLIKFEFDNSSSSPLLKSYLLRSNPTQLTAIYRFPISLSEIKRNSEEFPEWMIFLKFFDQNLVEELIASGIDSLSTYALLTSHPELRCFLRKPLILILASLLRSNFESLNITQKKNYRHWVPQLFKVDKQLTTGQVRVLARLTVLEPDHLMSATRSILVHFQKLHRFVPRTGEINAESVCLLIELLRRLPELENARWLCLRCTTSRENIEVLRQFYLETKSMLRSENVPDISRVLLKQTTSLNGLVALHDRFSDRINMRNLDPECCLDTRNMQDIPPFKLVRTVGELCRIAKRFRNCAAIYCSDGIEGRYVHWFYQKCEETALLQIDFSNPTNPALSQFYGPFNRKVSSNAEEDCTVFMQQILSSLPVDDQFRTPELAAELQ